MASIQSQLVQPRRVAPDEGRKHVASFSGGKDSSAMVVRMLETEMPLDKVAFAETTLEFKEIYDHIAWMDNWLIRHGLKVTFVDRRELIKAMKRTVWIDQNNEQRIIEKGENDPRTFHDWFKGYLASGHKEGQVRGWPRTTCRKGGTQGCWWMREAKYKPLQRVIGGDYTYIGFAFDESGRTMKALERPVYPLKDWGWTEAYCLKYLDKNSISKPIHHAFNRTGCFLCPYQSSASLRTLYENYPEEWKVIRELDRISPHNMKPDVSLDEIEDGSKISTTSNNCQERWF